MPPTASTGICGLGIGGGIIKVDVDYWSRCWHVHGHGDHAGRVHGAGGDQGDGDHGRGDHGRGAGVTSLLNIMLKPR